MPGSASYAILFLGTFLEALVVVCAIKRKVLRKYFVLNLYMVLCPLVSWGRHYILARDGVGSLNYRYFYFYTDALLTIVLYFGLISLYLSVFEEMKVGRYLRLGALALLAGTSWFTYAVVSQSSHKILTYFAFELSQNLYFVGLILTYVLWAAVLKMPQTPCATDPAGSFAGHLLQLLRRQLRSDQSSSDSLFSRFCPHTGSGVPAALVVGLRFLASSE